MGVEVTRAAGITYSGTQSDINEDCILKLEEQGIYAIADGDNGADGAQRAIATLQRSARGLHDTIAKVATNRSPRARLSVGRFFERVFQRAGDAIHDHARRTDQPRLSSTLTAVAFAHRYAFISHVGHTRAYLIRGAEIFQVTTDHTLPDDPTSLSQALGVTPRLDVAFAEVLLSPGDIILLCSDGLTRAVDDKTIRHVLLTEHVDSAVHRLVSMACDAGSADNVSVVAVDTGHGTKREAPAVDVAGTMRKVFMFETMCEAERMTIAPYLEEVTYKAGEEICREGAVGRDFFVIISGEVAVTHGPVHLVDIGPGGHFGEISLIHDGRRTATVTANEETLTYKFSRDQFEQVVKSKPGIGVQMLQPLLSQMAARVADLTQRLVAAS